MQTTNGVNYHRIINYTCFVNFVQILERIGELRIYIRLAAIFLSLLLICTNYLDVKTENSIRIFAQPTNATEQQNFWLRNLAGCKSSQRNSHFDIQHGHFAAIDIKSLDWIERTKLFIVTSENENDFLFEEAATALTSGHIQFHIIIDIPFVLFDTVVLTATQLNFLCVFVSAECVNCFASMCTNCTKKGFFLQHSSFWKNIFINILQAIITHAT